MASLESEEERISDLEPGPKKKQRLSLSLGKKGKFDSELKKDNRFASPIKAESLEKE